MTTTINASTTNGLVQTADTSGALAIQTANTTAMTINSSQNVGVGTTNPSRTLDVYGGSNTQFRVSSSGAEANMTINGGSYGQINNTTGDFYITNDGAGGSVYLRTASTTQVEVTAAGNLKFNSGYGSVATAYGCRAWVNFNGTGTVAIRGSGNVSSISDLGTGEYQVNFSTAMPDTNYNSIATPGGQEAGSPIEMPRRSTTPTTSAVRLIYNNGNADSLYVSVSIYR